MDPIWEFCQQEEEVEDSLSLIAVTKDVPTRLVKDGWHYHRDLLTENETLAM